MITLLAGLTLTAKAQTAPTFKFVAESHNFGKIKKDVPVTVAFSFVNEGDKPLIIKTAEASCGCTVPILEPLAGTPIKKGEKGKIRVTFNAQAEGEFIKHVTLNANTPNAQKILTIKGEVLKPAVK